MMKAPDFAVERIDHVALNVRSLQQSTEWYGRVLGLELGHRWSPEPWMIGKGGTWLALFEKPNGLPFTDRGKHIAFQHLAFQVSPAEFEAAQAHLRELNVGFKGPVDHEVAFSIYFNDLDGHQLEITCYPPKEA